MEYLVILLRFSAAVHIQECIWTKWLEIDQDNLHIKFVAQNVNFNWVSISMFKKSSVLKHQILVLLQNKLLSYCTLYIDSSGSGTGAVARHVSFFRYYYLSTVTISLPFIHGGWCRTTRWKRQTRSTRCLKRRSRTPLF